MATYEGEHNHPIPTLGEFNGSFSARNRFHSSRSNTSREFHPTSTVALDLTLCRNNEEEYVTKHTRNNKAEGSHISIRENNNIVEEYVNLLTRDPNTRAALAGAVAKHIHSCHQPKS